MKATQPSTTKKFQIRSDRYAVPEGLGSLEVNGSHFEILNYSTTGVAVVVSAGASHFKKGQEVEATLKIDDFSVASLKLHYLYQAPLEDRSERAAFEIVGPLLDAEQVRAAVEATRLIRETDKRREADRTLNSEYRTLVQETVCELKDFRDGMKHTDTHIARLSSSLRYSRQRGYALATAEFLHRRFRDFYSKMGAFLSTCHANEIPTHLNYFRNQFRDFLWQADTTHWNSNLPPTSRGTYGTIGLVLQGELEGNDLFSKALTMYHSDLLGDEALQHRTHSMSQRLATLLSDIKEKTEGTRVLSLASGINVELTEILKQIPPNKKNPFHFSVMDSEMNFLLHTQLATRDMAKKNAAAGGSVHFEHWAMKENLENYLQSNAPFDVIYSTYLLDCLSEEELLVYLAPLWDALAPKGTLILANVGKEFHSPVALELEINWNLVARTSQDLANLGISLTGDTQNIAIETDEARINLFLILQK